MQVHLPYMCTQSQWVLNSIQICNCGNCVIWRRSVNEFTDSGADGRLQCLLLKRTSDKYSKTNENTFLEKFRWPNSQQSKQNNRLLNVNAFEVTRGGVQHSLKRLPYTLSHCQQKTNKPLKFYDWTDLGEFTIDRQTTYAYISLTIYIKS